MEVEKPFKCSACSSRFTNEDHLQVHKKRHEMSLNLNKSGLNLTSGPEGFVDETPTPTRFIRNCEEVGLFQDLQNVNPFDEQFTKATSATPSHENYEFNFSDSNKKLPDDTLNTPQVFGYTAATSLPTSAVIPASIQNPGVSTTDPSESPDLEVDNDLPDSKSLAIACTAEDAKVESTTPDNESFIPPMFSMQGKVQSKLRLDLTPVGNSFSEGFISEAITLSKLSEVDGMADISGMEEDEGDAYSSNQDLRPPSKVRRKEVNTKKAELLERNRAAASRSRERRKQWVTGLETRCQTLQALLSASQSEVAKLRAENNFLREQLSKHGNCDVARSRVSVPRTPEFQPQILKHSSNSASRITPTTNGIIALSHAVASSATVIATPAVSALMKPNNTPVTNVKPKRGRPRKGFEKRADVISLPMSVSSASAQNNIPKVPQVTPTVEGPVKVEMLPVRIADGQPLTNVYILKRGP